jgi:hypothetical protein
LAFLQTSRRYFGFKPIPDEEGTEIWQDPLPPPAGRAGFKPIPDEEGTEMQCGAPTVLHSAMLQTDPR